MNKAFRKFGQAIGEKTGRLEATEIEQDFITLEAYTDHVRHGLEDVVGATEEYLIPDGAIRKLMKVQKSRKYKQPEGVLSEALDKTSRQIGQEIGQMSATLEYMGQVQRQIADARTQMDHDVTEQFLDPVRQFLKGEMQEVVNHKKKFKSRRLDYDVKKRDLDKKRDEKTEEAYRIAEGKFEESKELAMQGMVQLQNGEAEQISQLRAFVDAQKRFHESAISSLASLIDYLDQQINTVSSGTKREYAPSARYPDFGGDAASSFEDQSYGGEAQYGQPEQTPFQGNMGGADAGKGNVRALFDFEAEQEGELTFLKDDVIRLTAEIDENWMEGELNGVVGIFPTTYVERI